MPINTTLYHVNCHAVMPEDPCFRIMYTADKTQLTITLVEPDRAPEALGNAAEGFITDYIKWVHIARTALLAALLFTTLPCLCAGIRRRVMSAMRATVQHSSSVGRICTSRVLACSLGFCPAA